MKGVIFAGRHTPGAWGRLLHAAPPLKPCGTLAALQRHYRRGEDPCWACTAAAKAARDARRAP